MPAKKSVKKPVPAKKPAAKPVAKKAPVKKPVPAKKVVAKKPSAPQKAPAPKSQKKKAPTPAAKKDTKQPKTKPTVVHAPNTREKSSGPSDRARARILLTFDEIRDYLKTHRNVKINLFVPGDENDKSASAKKAALKAEAPKQKSRNIQAVSVADILGFNPFKKEEAKFEEEQIPQKWRKYYKILIDQRNKLQDGLALHSEDALKKSGKEDSGDLSGYGQHQADAGTDSFDRDFALGLVSGEQEMLFEITEAIERMKKGTYGVCEITGKPIPAERLLAVPSTRYTLEGQRQLERNRMGRRRGGIGNPVADLGEGMNFGGTGSGEETDEA